jgi:uncharacterized protein (TIGR02444 family)
MTGFWDFSVRTYGRPGVAEACLALQNRDGADVNMLMFAAWYGISAGPVPPARSSRCARCAPG